LITFKKAALMAFSIEGVIALTFGAALKVRIWESYLEEVREKNLREAKMKKACTRASTTYGACSWRLAAILAREEMMTRALLEATFGAFIASTSILSNFLD